MEKKKGRGPDKNPGTRKKRSDAGKTRGEPHSPMWVPNALKPVFDNIIKRFKNEKDKETDKKTDGCF